MKITSIVVYDCLKPDEKVVLDNFAVEKELGDKILMLLRALRCNDSGMAYAHVHEIFELKREGDQC